VDVQVAQADVKQALAAVEQAKANLEQAYVRSPQEGQILKIHTRPGELISNDGIAEIGRTQQMFAIAEVYESDIKNIRPGQRARVSSDSIDGELNGSVEQVGYKVLRQDIVNTDPSANIDARIVEVKIRLDANSSRKAARLTNQQVKVVIQL
jgi:HlyD family secretion protein